MYNVLSTNSQIKVVLKFGVIWALSMENVDFHFFWHGGERTSGLGQQRRFCLYLHSDSLRLPGSGFRA